MCLAFVEFQRWFHDNPRRTKPVALGGKRPARAGWARAGRGKGWKKGYFLAFLAGAFFAGAFLVAFLVGLSSGIS